MAALQFEGAVACLSEKQVKFVREVLEERGFVNNKVLFEPAGNAGDNFTANVLRITVTVDEADDFKMIAKIAPQHEIMRIRMNSKAMFNHETLMYEDVLPKYDSLLKEAGLLENERLKYAKCYGCLSEEPHEVILLEDLKPLDYVMLDRLEPMEEDAVLLVLKNLAILHSMAFVLRHLEPETYENFRSRLTNLWYSIMSGKEQIEFITQVENSALAVLDEEQYKSVIRGVISQANTFIDEIKKHDHPKNLVIQQGDAWTNNIMFKLNEAKPVDAIMIDYQLVSETSPAADILYFMFNCTNHDARSRLYLKWLNFYYEHFDKYLTKFDLKGSLIYPREQLDADLKRYSKFFIGNVIMVCSVITRSSEEAADIHEALSSADDDTTDIGVPVNNLSGHTVKKFKHKIEDLIDSYRQFGYID